MHSIRLVWGYMPSEVRTSFRPVLMQYLWLLPSWCRSLAVRYQQLHHTGVLAVGSAETLPEYRRAGIWVHGAWLDESPRERRLSIIHELMHVPLGPLVMDSKENVDRLAPVGESPILNASLAESHRRSMEGTVQDLTYSILAIPEAALAQIPVPCITEEEDEHPPTDDTTRNRIAAGTRPL